MSKKKRIKKTLVEKMLDAHNIPYQQFVFPTKKVGDVQQMVFTDTGVDEHHVYKTLVLSGKKTGPLVGVVPIDMKLNEKALARASHNKKVEMIPLKKLRKTSGYQHGANTPIGIYEQDHYPIFISEIAKQQGTIWVSSGQIGRSVKIKAADLAEMVRATFAKIAVPK